MLERRNSLVLPFYLATTFSWLIILLGVVVLVGWNFQIDALMRFNSKWTSMKPNAAICFGLSGSALLLLINSKKGYFYKFIVFTIILISGVAIIEYVFKWNSGIDELLFKDDEGVIFPGRMAPNAAVMFLLSGIALLIYIPGNKMRHQIGELLVIPVVLIAFVAIVGYMYGTDKLYKISGFTSLAFHTGWGFLFFSIGFFSITSLHPQSLFSTFNKDTNAARVGIHQVFVLIIVIVFIGWVQLQIQYAGYFDTEFGVSVMIISFALTFFFITLSGTKKLNRLELQRMEAEKLITASEKKFRGLLDAAPDAILIVNREGNISIANVQAESLFGYSRQELVGMIIEKLIPQDLHGKHLKNKESFFTNPKTRSMGSGFNLYALRKDGEKFPVEISLSPLETSDGLVISAAVRDITDRVNAMKALKESEERYVKMVEAVEDYSIVLLDKKGTIQNWNKGAEKMNGYEEKEIVGKNFEIFFTTEDQRSGLPAKLLAQAGKNGKATLEGMRMRKDRTLFWMSETLSTVYNEHKEIIGFSKVARDITEIKKATEALKHSEQQVKAIFLGAPDAVIVIDEEDKVIQWNPKATELFGWTEEEVMGQTLGEKIVPQHFWKAYKNGIQHFISTHESGIMGQNIEIKAIKKDQKEFDVSLNISPIKLNNGYLFVGFIRDITLQKKALENTLNNERRFKKALGILGDNVWEHDYKKEKTFFANTVEDLLGYPNTDLSDNVGLWWSRIHPDDRWMLEEGDKKYREGLKQSHSMEYRMYHKDGFQLWILDRGVVIEKDDDGKPLRIVGTHTDITKRRENKLLLEHLNENLEKKTTELSASNKELEQFAYVASHDLQEPLRMVSSFMQLLQKKYKGQLDETADKYIHLAVDGAERMKILIHDLLSLSRVGTLDANFTTVDISVSLQNVLGSLRQKIEENNATIYIGKMPVIKAVASQIDQVFLNLISNAIKYRGEASPEITIDCLEKDAEWEFFVKDNGIGLDKKYEEKIFVIFQRLHTKNEYPGTGIGLAICKKIVERHGGKFHLESELGKGSTFFFTISKNLK